MEALRVWPKAGVRIGLALAAGIVVGGASSGTGTGEAGQPWACQSRSDCGPRIMGGLRITFTGWSCTTGFIARETETSTVVLLTAGHCLASSGLSAVWSHHGVAIGRASVEAFRSGSSADVGEMKVTESGAGNAIYGSSGTDTRSVTAWASNASQTVGSRVCRSGATSGWRCGSIVAADVDATIEGTLIRHTWWTDFPSAAGDSGSPVLDGDGRAAGMIIATTPTQSLYSTIDGIDSELRARPCVTPRCD